MRIPRTVNKMNTNLREPEMRRRKKREKIDLKE
jgi:hypothetical protein